MSVEVRVVPEDRFAELIRRSEVAFTETIEDDLIGRVETVSDKSRFIGAFDGSEIVGTAGVFTLSVTVPGGEVAAGGVTFVTVLPTHRRRGIMAGMMRRMIDDCHERGEPIAMLWAAEGAIYQRFGYGMATRSFQLDAETAAFRYTREWPREGQMRLIPAGEGKELVESVYEKARWQWTGFLKRDDRWWPGVLPNPEKDKRGGEIRRLAVYEADAGPEAYAVYKTKGDWNVRGSTSILTVEEAIGSTPRGTREIWRFLMEVDLMRTLGVFRMPGDHPIFSLVAEPRRLGTTMGDGLWVRILDVAKALEARTYGPGGDAEGSLVFELSDAYCPWNAGRYRLEVSGGRARVAPTTESADLTLDANDLAAMYLGEFSATALSLTGRVTASRPEGLAKADRLFTTALRPWCPTEF